MVTFDVEVYIFLTWMQKYFIMVDRLKIKNKHKNKNKKLVDCKNGTK